MDKKTGGTLKLHTSIEPSADESQSTQKTERKSARKPSLRRKTFSERLLRNTAVSCALLMGIMALKHIHTPFTEKVTAAIRSVVKMELPIDESIGRLSFVQKIMPESALVFLNMTGEEKPDLPAAGEVFHAYTEKQPWTEMHTMDHTNVYSILPGIVTACVQTTQGDYTLCIRHTDGSEAVYAYLCESKVQTGDAVEKSDVIGVTGAQENARLYLEYRVNGDCVDPKDLFKVY